MAALVGIRTISRMKWAHPTVWFMTNLRASDAASADLADAGIQNCFTSPTVRSRCHIEPGAPCRTAPRLVSQRHRF